MRVFTFLLRYLSRHLTHKAFAAKLAKEAFTEESKFLYRCLSANTPVLAVCTLELLAAIVEVDQPVADFLFETFDFSLKVKTTLRFYVQ